MRVGSLEETVTVTGEASVVDVQSVTQQVTLGKDVLDAIPAGRNQHNFANLIPGMTGPLDYGGQNNLNLNTITVHGSRADDQRVMVDGMSISATSGNGQLSNFIPDMTSTQEVAVSYSAGYGRAGVRRRPDEPDSARRRQQVQGVLLRHRCEREVAVEQLHGRTEERGPADAQFPQGGLRRQSGRRRPAREGQAVVLLGRPLADDAELYRRPVREQERGRPDQMGLRTGSRAAGRSSRWSREASTRA